MDPIGLSGVITVSSELFGSLYQFFINIIFIIIDVLLFLIPCYRKICKSFIIRYIYPWNRSYHIYIEWDDKEMTKEAIKSNHYNIISVDDSIANDEQCILEFIQVDYRVLEYIYDFTNTDEFMLKAVGLNGLSLKYGSKNVQDNKDIAIEAINNNALALNYVSKRLLCDEEIVIRALKKNKYLSSILDDDTKNKRNIYLLIHSIPDVFMKCGRLNDLNFRFM